MKAIVWLAVVGVIFTAAPAGAQSTTGTISGRVVDSQGLALPGVTVTATSPNLQATRETVTSENGDYILTLLPSGTYRIVFELAGFQRVERSVGLAPTQNLPLPIEMGVAGVTEAVQVVGRLAARDELMIRRRPDHEGHCHDEQGEPRHAEVPHGLGKLREARLEERAELKPEQDLGAENEDAPLVERLLDPVRERGGHVTLARSAEPSAPPRCRSGS